MIDKIITDLETEVFKASMNMPRVYALETAIDIVKKHANDGWHVVADGDLPLTDISKSYLVTKMCQDDGELFYDVCNEIFWINDNKWDCERDELCEWKVIAWKEQKPYIPK